MCSLSLYEADADASIRGFPQGYLHVNKCVDNFVCGEEHGWSYPQTVDSPASDVLGDVLGHG
jgi:hypothetical protein